MSWMGGGGSFVVKMKNKLWIRIYCTIPLCKIWRKKLSRFKTEKFHLSRPNYWVMYRKSAEQPTLNNPWTGQSTESRHPQLANNFHYLGPNVRMEVLVTAIFIKWILIINDRNTYSFRNRDWKMLLCLGLTI